MLQLAEHVSEPGSQALLRRAIGDARPELRMLAARVVYVTRPAADFTSELVEALAKEPDADAIREQIRALASMKSPDSDAAIFAAWRRIGRALGVDTYATLRNAAALQALAHLQAIGTTRESQTIFAIEAIGSSTESLRSSMAAALATRDWATLRVTFDVADRTRLDPGEDVLSSVLIAPESGPARLRAIWYVLGRRDVGARLRAALETALPLDTASQNVDAREQAIVLEFAGRAIGRPARTDTAWPGILRPSYASAAAASMGYPDTLLLRPGILSRITDAEASAAGIRLPPPDARARILSGPTSQPAATPVAAGSIRTISGFPPGVIADVLALTGCATSPTGRTGVAVRVSFTADGRVASSSPSEPKASPECVAAMRLLTGVYVKEPSVYNPFTGARAPELLALPLLTPFIQCADTAPGPLMTSVAPGDQPRMLGGRPKFQTRNISFDGLIASSGCVHEMAVVQSDNPKDNWSALTDAVSWKFAPFPASGPPMAFRYNFSQTTR